MIECEITLEDFEVDQNPEAFAHCCSLRREIFCQEQGVAESSEIDGEDEKCRHVVARLRSDGAILATCRLCSIGPYVKLERVAVRQNWRGHGVGERICRRAIKLAESLYDTKTLVTQSQSYVVKFYEQLGFSVISDEYVEAGILHKTMYYFPRRDRLPALDLWKCGDVEHEYVPGECYDPVIMERIRERLMLYKEQNIPRIVHLQHLPDEHVIGRSLIRAYRECALATRAHNFTRSEQLEEFITSIAWEKLNTGHYAEVAEAWRFFYSCASACKAVRLKYEGRIQEALYACDMGLIMGRDIDDGALSKFAYHLHSSLPEPSIPVSLKAQKVLDVPDPLPNSETVSIFDRPSFEEMLKLIVEQKPVVIKGLVNEWPAFVKWNFSYFNEIIGHRTVPVEVGSSYANSGWKQTLMTVRDFIKKFVENESSDGPGYIAQHRLFDQIPELLDDIIAPDYCAFGEDGIDNVDMNIWIGPAGTVSPLHTDPKSNIFCQVAGRKFLRIVPVSETENVYPREDGILTNTSQIDVRNPDLAKFPRFRNAHIFDCTLDAGECLYIPAGFWHYVLALDPSISVSCWFTAEI